MANTTYAELIRQVMMKLQPRSDGVTRLAVEQAINDAHKVIACIKDFDELKTLDTTHALTVANQKLYHIETDLALVRPKDIYSIRLMDEANSRKLIFVPLSELDSKVPYTELTGTGRSLYYTIRGRYVELYRIPDAVYHLYVQHSQWPTVLVDDTDQTDYIYIDHVIVTLAADMALASLEGGSGDWFARAKQLLGITLEEDETRPDQFYVAQPFEPTKRAPLGQWWLNPWVRRDPQ